jgi:hypothetical protein
VDIYDADRRPLACTGGLERFELSKGEPYGCPKTADLSIDLGFPDLYAVKLAFQSVEADNFSNRNAAGYNLCREPKFRRGLASVFRAMRSVKNVHLKMTVRVFTLRAGPTRFSTFRR